MGSMRNSLRRNFSLVLGLAFALFSAPTAHAELGWIGGSFGMSIPSADNTSSRTMYGITGGAKIGSEWGVGGYYLTSTKKEEMNGASINFGYDLYGVELAYHFEGEAAGVFVGGRLGTSKVKTENAGNSISTSPMHYGPVAGFNRMIIEGVSLGGDVSYLILDKGTTSGVNVPGFGALNFLATAKIWF